MTNWKLSRNMIKYIGSSRNLKHRKIIFLTTPTHARISSANNFIDPIGTSHPITILSSQGLQIRINKGHITSHLLSICSTSSVRQSMSPLPADVRVTREPVSPREEAWFRTLSDSVASVLLKGVIASQTRSTPITIATFEEGQHRHEVLHSREYCKPRLVRELVHSQW